SQMLFHTLFVLGTPTSGAAMQSMPAGHHHGHGMMQMPAVSEHTITLVHGDTVMWLSHLIGALVTVAFLYRGEQAIHRLRAVAEQFVALVRHRLTTPIQLPVLTAPARVRPAEAGGLDGAVSDSCIDAGPSWASDGVADRSIVLSSRPARIWREGCLPPL
ncbi:MAG: hypothetical protein ACTHW3_11085, partial [Leucobacter sp.]